MGHFGAILITNEGSPQSLNETTATHDISCVVNIDNKLRLRRVILISLTTPSGPGRGLSALRAFAGGPALITYTSAPRDLRRMGLKVLRGEAAARHQMPEPLDTFPVLPMCIEPPEAVSCLNELRYWNRSALNHGTVAHEMANGVPSAEGYGISSSH